MDPGPSSSGDVVTMEQVDEAADSSQELLIALKRAIPQAL